MGRVNYLHNIMHITLSITRAAPLWQVIVYEAGLAPPKGLHTIAIPST